MACKGVEAVRDMRVTATGWVHIDDEHVVRRDLRKLVAARGAIWHDEAHLKTDIVILGEIRDYQASDDRVGGVDALEQVYRSRGEGIHIHLVRRRRCRRSACRAAHPVPADSIAVVGDEEALTYVDPAGPPMSALPERGRHAYDVMLKRGVAIRTLGRLLNVHRSNMTVMGEKRGFNERHHGRLRVAADLVARLPDEVPANEWLKSPHPGLAGRSPLDLISAYGEDAPLPAGSR